MTPVSAWCAQCGDEFEPVEYRPLEIDEDEPNYCSAECEDTYLDQVDAELEYDVARYEGASVF